jgi:hypothetical protein
MSNVINFELLKLQLLKCNFSHNPGFTEPPEGEISTITLSIGNAGDFSEGGTIAHFVQSFKTQVTDSMPFNLEVEYGAVFSMAAPVPKTKYDQYIHHFFPQQVFPYLREYVAEITRRGGFPPLLFTMSMYADLNREKNDQDTSSQVTAKWIH